VERECIHIITITFQDLPENPNQLLSLAESALGGDFGGEFPFFHKRSIQDRLEGVEKDRMWSIHGIQDE